MRRMIDAAFFGAGTALVCIALDLSIMCAIGITFMGCALIAPNSEPSK